MMSPEDVQAFLTRKGWSDAEMERQSGYSRNTLAKYKAEGAPLQFALVCSALDAKLAPWTPHRGNLLVNPLVDALGADPMVQSVEIGTEILPDRQRDVLLVEYEHSMEEVMLDDGSDTREAIQFRPEFLALAHKVIDAGIVPAVIVRSAALDD
jgi:lambda repressor-like predicted transcriptional regulator